MIVIGDRIIDEYLIGTSKRLSPEAPVPVIQDYKRQWTPGGAANVVGNLIALGENPRFIYNTQQPETVKTRIVADNHMICRLDKETYVPFEPDLNKYALEIGGPVIISDYNKGVIHDPESIIAQFLVRGSRIYVDPKKKFERYKNAYLIKPNKKEFEQETGLPYTDDTAALRCMYLCRDYGFKYIVVTLGADGCYAYDDTIKRGKRIYSDKRTVLDVTGAGDVFMSALVHFMESSVNFYEAVGRANDLAGISVSHQGTYVLTHEDIQSVIPVTPKIVFTNGCFDLLHPGHIHLLKESKKLGDRLIVGLNSDQSVQRLKGLTRPVLDEHMRKAMLESLDIADEVIIFDEDTPLELIKKIKPDIVTKGGDYQPHQVVGYGLVPEIAIIALESGYSTTGVIDEIKRKG